MSYVRDTRKARAYFDHWIAYNESRIKEMQKSISEFPSASTPAQLAYLSNFFAKHHQSLLMRYSRGDDRTLLADWLNKTIDAWSLLGSKVSSVSDTSARQYQELNLSSYRVALWLLGFGVYLNTNPELLKRILSLVGNEGKDGLLDLVAARINGRPTSTSTPLFSKQYGRLYSGLTNDGSDLRQEIKRFISDWYKGTRSEGWHDSHLQDDTGYFGYWAFEAALVVRLWKIDDELFRDLAYYPKALASEND